MVPESWERFEHTRFGEVWRRRSVDPKDLRTDRHPSQELKGCGTTGSLPHLDSNKSVVSRKEEEFEAKGRDSRSRWYTKSLSIVYGRTKLNNSKRRPLN